MAHLFVKNMESRCRFVNGRETYLIEREYCKAKQEKVDLEQSEKNKFWECLWKKEKLSELMDDNEEIKMFLQADPYSVSKLNIENEIIVSGEEVLVAENYLKSEKSLFTPFYSKWIGWGIECMRKRNNKASGVLELDFVKYCLECLQNASIRVLILEMNKLKIQERLHGESAGEEYDDYNERYLRDNGYIRKIQDKYPVLFRIMREQITQCVSFFSEILESLDQERHIIEQKLMNGDLIRKVGRIKCMCGDKHNSGRSVAKVVVNDSIEIIYKPHSLDNEIIYQDILHKISDEIQMKQYNMKIINYKDHGWEEKICFEECTSRDGIARYYERMGVHIFLAYCLGTNDLHCENMLAKGEFPVLVDLETLVSQREKNEKKYCGQKITESVLRSGLLPSYSPDEIGLGNDISALSGKGGVKGKTKIPVIRDAYTSKMRIEYRAGNMNYSGSVVKTKI